MTSSNVLGPLAVWCVCLGMLTGCVSVTVHPLKRPDAAVDASPMLVLVHQGGYDLGAARELEASLQDELKQAHVQARTMLVSSDVLKEQSGIEASRAQARTVLRIVPIAGTRLSGVATHITYDASLHQRVDDKRLWQAQVQVRSGILERQLSRRQKRAARKLVAQMKKDQAL